jgi:hypothetical protein
LASESLPCLKRHDTALLKKRRQAFDSDLKARQIIGLFFRDRMKR